MRKATVFLLFLSLLLTVATTSQTGIQYRGTEIEDWTAKLPTDILNGDKIPLWVGLQEEWSAILATNPNTRVTHLYFLPEGGVVFQEVWDDSTEKTRLMEVVPGNRLAVHPPAINKNGLVMKTRPWPPRNTQNFFFNPKTLEVKLLFSGGYEEWSTRVLVDTLSAAGLTETTIRSWGNFWPTSSTTFVGPLKFAFGLANGIYQYNSNTGEFTLLSRHSEAIGQLVNTSDVVGDSEGNLYWNVSNIGGVLKFDEVSRVLGVKGTPFENSGQVISISGYSTDGTYRDGTYRETISKITPNDTVTTLFEWDDNSNSLDPFIWLYIRNLNHNFGVFTARYRDGSINLVMWNGEKLVPWIQSGNTLPGNLGTVIPTSDLLSKFGTIGVYQDTGLFFSYNDSGTKAENLYWFQKSDQKPSSLEIKRVVSATSFVEGKSFSPGEIATLFFTGEQLPEAVTVAGVDAPILFSSIEDREGQVNFFIPDSLKGLDEVEVVLKGLEDSLPVQIRLDNNPLPKPFMTSVSFSDGTPVEPGFKFPVITTDLLDENGKPLTNHLGIPYQILVGPNDEFFFHPIADGRWITMWATGCGFANIADGVATPYPGVAINYNFKLYVGGVQPEISWVGRTAGFRGLCQINLQVPTGTSPRVPESGEPSAPKSSTPMWFETQDGQRSEIFWLIVEN